MATSPVYDTIGRGYIAHRRPEPSWEAVIAEQLGDGRVVVNVGAGTGNYEPADRAVIAVEPSGVMIGQRPPGAAPAVRASSSALPLPSGVCRRRPGHPHRAPLGRLGRRPGRALPGGPATDRPGHRLRASTRASGSSRTTSPRWPSTRGAGPRTADAIAEAIGATVSVPLLVPARHGRRRPRCLLVPTGGVPRPGGAGQLLRPRPGRPGGHRPGRRRTRGGLSPAATGTGGTPTWPSCRRSTSGTGWSSAPTTR